MLKHRKMSRWHQRRQEVSWWVVSLFQKRCLNMLESEFFITEINSSSLKPHNLTTINCHHCWIFCSNFHFHFPSAYCLISFSSAFASVSVLENTEKWLWILILSLSLLRSLWAMPGISCRTFKSPRRASKPLIIIIKDCKWVSDYDFVVTWHKFHFPTSWRERRKKWH